MVLLPNVLVFDVLLQHTLAIVENGPVLLFVGDVDDLDYQIRADVVFPIAQSAPFGDHPVNCLEVFLVVAESCFAWWGGWEVG